MKPPRWFKGCLTAWCIHVAIYRWELIGWREFARRPSLEVRSA